MDGAARMRQNRAGRGWTDLNRERFVMRVGNFLKVCSAQVPDVEPLAYGHLSHRHARPPLFGDMRPQFQCPCTWHRSCHCNTPQDYMLHA